MKNNEIRNIYKKFGEPVFRMALSHMVAIGSNRMKKVVIEDAVREILTAGSNGLITHEMQIEILKCSWELAQHELWDILAFVQTDIGIQGVTIHPGVIVDFFDSRTDKKCCTYVLPADIDEDLIEEVADTIRKKRSLHNYGGQLDAAIRTELREKGVTVKPVGQDFGIEI